MTEMGDFDAKRGIEKKMGFFWRGVLNIK